jgi:hypothetical protein
MRSFFAEDVETARISAMQKYAIAGLGVTPQGVIPGTSAAAIKFIKPPRECEVGLRRGGHRLFGSAILVMLLPYHLNPC